jgi:hypothetical protein
MKKLAIGCGVVLVLLAVGAGVVFYMAARRASSYLRETGVVDSLQSIGKGVTNTASFTPPANGELTAEWVARFAAVEDAMVARLGPRFQQIAAMQDEMLQREQAEHRKSTSAEDFKNVSAMMGFVLQAQGAWVDALNQQKFSMDEYQWVRGQVWAASGLNVVELASRDLAAAMKKGGETATREIAPAGPVPARNRQLVEPLMQKLKDWMPLAFFGL